MTAAGLGSASPAGGLAEQHVALAGAVIMNRPLSWWRPAVAALARFVQAVIEAAFLVFGEEALGVAVVSALGNTFFHGLAWGAIPLVLLVPLLHGRRSCSGSRRRGRR